MEKTQKLPYDALTKGYILVPKQMVEQLMCHSNDPLSELEAWLVLLTTVNYKDLTCRMGEREYVCKRGESLHSTLYWSSRFRWPRSTTRYFFARLQRQNLIRLIPHPCTTHLQIVDYELWVGCRTAARSRIAAQTDEAFEVFWKTYHRITQADKVNIARARREWAKLSPEERALATRHIEEYYYHLRNVKYCMQAAAYLSNKAFLNEYID